MPASSLIESLRDTLVSRANVTSVYGEPITAHGKTIVPLARIAYGFGFGAGSGRARHSENGGEPREGGGGGGGVAAIPIGVVEITPTDTRYIPFVDRKRLAASVVAGVLLGLLLGKRRRAR